MSDESNGSAATLALAQAIGRVVAEAADKAADKAVDKHAVIVIREIGKLRSDYRKLDSRVDGIENRLETVERKMGVALR